MKLSLVALTSVLAAGVFASPAASDANLMPRTNLCGHYTKKYAECKKKEDYYKHKYEDCEKKIEPYKHGKLCHLAPLVQKHR